MAETEQTGFVEPNIREFRVGLYSQWQQRSYVIRWYNVTLTGEVVPSSLPGAEFSNFTTRSCRMTITDLELFIAQPTAAVFGATDGYRYRIYF